jgi:hypothetical protein
VIHARPPTALEMLEMEPSSSGVSQIVQHSMWLRSVDDVGPFAPYPNCSGPIRLAAEVIMSSR